MFYVLFALCVMIKVFFMVYIFSQIFKKRKVCANTCMYKVKISTFPVAVMKEDHNIRITVLYSLISILQWTL